MSRRRQLAVAFLIAAVLGATGSALLISAWAGENLGGDFRDLDTGRLDVGYTTVLFLLTSAALTVPLMIIVALASIAARVVARRRFP
jgi:hypothetical protein